MKKRLNLVSKLIRSAEVLDGESDSFCLIVSEAISELASLLLVQFEDAKRDEAFGLIKRQIEQSLRNDLGANFVVELSGISASDLDEVDDVLSEIASVHNYKFTAYKSPKCWTVKAFVLEQVSQMRFRNLLSENLSGKCEIKVVK